MVAVTKRFSACHFLCASRASTSQLLVYTLVARPQPLCSNALNSPPRKLVNGRGVMRS